MNNEVGGVAAREVGAGTSWMVGRYIIILDCQNLANVGYDCHIRMTDLTCWQVHMGTVCDM